MKSQKFKKGGFTLLETLLYIAIFAIIFTVIVQFTLVTSENNKIALTRKEFGDLILFINSHFEESINSSVSIDTNSTIFNNDNGRLRMLKSDGTYIQYELTNNLINVSRNGDISNLISPGFICDKMYLQPVNSIAGITVGVRITFNCLSNRWTQVNSEFISNYILNL